MKDLQSNDNEKEVLSLLLIGLALNIKPSKNPN